MSTACASPDPVARFAMTPRRRQFHHGETGELVLSYYPAGHRMPEHAHDMDQRSIVLSGALAEETPSCAATPSASHLGFKAAGLRHENRYGPSGALILALNAVPEAEQEDGWRWAPTQSAAQIGALLSTLMRQPETPDGVVDDLLALMSASPVVRESVAPFWVRQAREAVLADPDAADLNTLADEAGVHRVSLSRAYSRYFNTPISLDRRRARLGQAVQALLERGASPADAAYEAGFADQPHFARTLKTQTGLTPRALMRVFADGAEPVSDVTNVQDQVSPSA